MLILAFKAELFEKSGLLSLFVSLKATWDPLLLIHFFYAPKTSSRQIIQIAMSLPRIQSSRIRQICEFVFDLDSSWRNIFAH